MQELFRTAMATVYLLVLFIPALPFPGEGTSLTGHWEGTIEIPGNPLEFNVDFIQGDEGLTGDISIPAQKAVNLPLSDIQRTNNKVTFAISGIPGNPVFSGTVTADGMALSGDFTQSGQTFPFKMKKRAGFKSSAKKALSDFDELVQRGLSALNVPGIAVAVVAEDEVLLAEGYGQRDRENNLPMTADTLLAIGSASKALTTFSLGAMADAGKMEWEKPVRTYIPWFRLYDQFATERMTPRDLVTHRSGLPRHDFVWYNETDLNREEMVRRLAYLKPTADLRARFQYNNLMFLTAGYLLEVLTEKSWEDAVRSLVFNPLDMNRTNFSVDDSQQDPDHALPYREREGKLERIPFRNISNIGPAGSINSSVTEMSRWVLVHLNLGKYKDNQLLNAETVQDMHLAHMTTGETPAIPELTPADYGLGWFVDSYQGHRRVHHGGNIDGFSAMVSFFPQDGLGFVILANKNGTSLPELLIRHAADKIFGLEEKDWIGEAEKQLAAGREADEEAEKKSVGRQIKGTKPAHPLKDYAGVYQHPGYGKLIVSVENKQLLFKFNHISTPLEHWHYETFNAQRGTDPTFEDMKLTFRTDANGMVSALEIPLEPTLDEISFQKQPDPKYFDSDYLLRFTGDYKLTGQTIQIYLKGDSLALVLPGQPEYTLIPDLGGEFYLDKVKAIRVKFITREAGNATAMEIIQGGGVYEAEKIDK